MLKPRSTDEETAKKPNLCCWHILFYKYKYKINNLLNLSEINKYIKQFKDSSSIFSKPDHGNGCVLINKINYLKKWCFNW